MHVVQDSRWRTPREKGNLNFSLYFKGEMAKILLVYLQEIARHGCRRVHDAWF